MVVGPGITGPPCQTRGGEAPSGLVGSHKGPEMACALTMPLNLPIFVGSRDAQGPAFVVPAAAEPAVVSMPAASMPKASSPINFLICPPLLNNAEDEVCRDPQGGVNREHWPQAEPRTANPPREAGAAYVSSKLKPQASQVKRSALAGS